MPRYDYQCTACGHGFELKQSFASEPVATCPVCQSSARRVIHSVPVMFKGSGWYVNDYGKGRGAAAAADGKESEKETKEKPESSSKSDSDSKDSSGSDSKDSKATKKAKAKG